jgi:hypothetical protein
MLIDVGFKDKPKVLELQAEFGPLARLLFLDIMAAMSAATNAEVTIAVIRMLGDRIGISAQLSEAIVSWCLMQDMLAEANGRITNIRVIEDQESYFQTLSKSKQEAIRKRADYQRRKSGEPENSPGELARKIHGKSGGESPEKPSISVGESDYVNDPDPENLGGAGGQPPTPADCAPLVDGCTYFRLWPVQLEMATKAYLDRSIDAELVDWAIRRQDRRMVEGLTDTAIKSRGLPSHYGGLVDYMISEAEKEQSQRARNRRGMGGQTAANVQRQKATIEVVKNFMGDEETCPILKPSANGSDRNRVGRIVSRGGGRCLLCRNQGRVSA